MFPYRRTRYVLDRAAISRANFYNSLKSYHRGLSQVGAKRRGSRDLGFTRAYLITRAAAVRRLANIYLTP